MELSLGNSFIRSSEIAELGCMAFSDWRAAKYSDESAEQGWKDENKELMGHQAEEVQIASPDPQSGRRMRKRRRFWARNERHSPLAPIPRDLAPPWLPPRT